MKNILIIAIFFLSISCSQDDSFEERNVPSTHRLEFKTTTLDASVNVDLTTDITFTSGPGEEVESVYNSNTKTISVDFPENTVRFRAVFNIEDSSEVEVKFYNVSNEEIILKETIHQNIYILEYDF